MKLLVVINNLEAGGAEKLLVSTLPLIREKGLDVCLLLLSGKNSEQTYLKQLENNYIEVIDLNCKSVYDIIAIKRIKTQIKMISPDIVHVHLFPAMYWVALATCFAIKTPLVFTEHSTQNRRLNNIFFRYIDKFIYSRYKSIICISNPIKDILYNKYKLKNINVVSNGVDFTYIDSIREINRYDLLSSLNITDTSSKLIFMAARFDYPKRQDLLIAVFKMLPSNYHLLLAGDGKNLPTCKLLANDLVLEEQVHFLGFRPDVISLMKSVDLNILMSDYEGLSGVALESLGSGIPFLGSNVPGINNIVAEDDFVFDNIQTQTICKKITKVLKDDSFKMRQITRAADIIKKYDINDMISSYIHLYEKLTKS